MNSPFSISPASGSIPPQQAATLTIRFAPNDEAYYDQLFLCTIPFLHVWSLSSCACATSNFPRAGGEVRGEREGKGRGASGGVERDYMLINYTNRHPRSHPKCKCAANRRGPCATSSSPKAITFPPLVAFPLSLGPTAALGPSTHAQE
jgi:hypothetical protein